MASDGAIQAVASAKQRILTAPSVGEALDSMMAALHASFSLWFGVIARYAGPGEAMILASWSPAATPFEPGVVVQAHTTPGIERLHGEVMSGRTVVFDPEELDAGLLGDLIGAGPRTTVVGIPIIHGRGTEGVVGFVSADPDCVDDEGIRLLEALVDGSSEPLAGWCRAAAAQEVG